MTGSSSVTQGYGTGRLQRRPTPTTSPRPAAPRYPTGTTYCTQTENGLSQTTTSYYNSLDQMIEQASAQHHGPDSHHLHLRRRGQCADEDRWFGNGYLWL